METLMGAFKEECKSNVTVKVSMTFTSFVFESKVIESAALGITSSISGLISSETEHAIKQIDNPTIIIALMNIFHTTRSEEHTSELQLHSEISSSVFCL